MPLRVLMLMGLVVALGACSSVPQPETTGSDVVIERIIDGDSLELVADGEPLEVRLLGINAPELRSPSGEQTCVGQAAKAELSVLLDATSIALIDEGIDRFGRTLAVLTADGRSVNELMVESGWALGLWSADDPGLVDLMRTAADAERGWWGDLCRLSSSELAIGGHEMNPPGDDSEKLNEEWVEVVNLDAEPVELGGWVLRDETTTNRFTLDGLTLDAGSTVRIHVGVGSPSGSDVYLNNGSPVWSNNGETVLLLEPDGAIAAYAFVEG